MTAGTRTTSKDEKELERLRPQPAECCRGQQRVAQLSKRCLHATTQLRPLQSIPEHGQRRRPGKSDRANDAEYLQESGLRAS